jgi:hypothetical protein
MIQAPSPGRGSRPLPRSERWPRRASAVEWRVGEAKPPGFRRRTDSARNRKHRGAARAGRCLGRSDPTRATGTPQFGGEERTIPWHASSIRRRNPQDCATTTYRSSASCPRYPIPASRHRIPPIRSP